MPIAEADIEFLRSLVARKSGNILRNGHGYLIESRLATVATTHGLPNVEALIADLKRSPLRYEDSVAEAMTINETSFFRDVSPFEALRINILPALLNSRSATKELSIWSAASSSGQEPYSIAMTIREYFPQLKSWKIKILATDICDEMVRRTRDGAYSQFEVNRGLSTKMLIKYFDRKGGFWHVKDDLRSWVESRKMNLTATWMPLPRFDIIFMRNVLIYFDQAAKQSILQRAAQNLVADGALFLGGGESYVSLNVPFSRETVDRTVFFRPAGRFVEVPV